jgi:hypothetical protein
MDTHWLYALEISDRARSISVAAEGMLVIELTSGCDGVDGEIHITGD